MRFRASMMALLLALAAPVAFSGEATPLAADPKLEARVMRLAEELRCLVCQNQTIADSHAGLAVDLKNQIREQLQAGRSDAEIMEYMVDRYGDFVRYRPPIKATTVLLWCGPFLLLGGGVFTAWRVVRRRRDAESGDAEPTSEQRVRAAALLADEPEAHR